MRRRALPFLDYIQWHSTVSKIFSKQAAVSLQSAFTTGGSRKGLRGGDYYVYYSDIPPFSSGVLLWHGTGSGYNSPVRRFQNHGSTWILVQSKEGETASEYDVDNRKDSWQQQQPAFEKARLDSKVHQKLYTTRQGRFCPIQPWYISLHRHICINSISDCLLLFT